jgi:RNA polymerase sigma-70 factor (ECF subfamily)
MSADEPLRLPNAQGAVDPGWWERLYERELAPLHRFVYRRVGSVAESEDIVQMTMARAIGHVDPAAPPAAIRGYLYRIAKNLIADYWSRQAALPLSDIDVADLTLGARAAAPSDAEERALTERVETVLSLLPENYRRVLELRFLESRSVAETASAMGITVTNAKIMQYRAVRRAAREMGLLEEGE